MGQRSHNHSRRCTGFALAVLVPALLVSGCTWWQGTKSIKLPRGRPPPRLELPPPPAVLSRDIPTAASQLSAASTVDDAARGFSDLAEQDDLLGDALTRAVCAGMEELSKEDDETTGENWREFLIGQVTDLVISELPIVGAVDGLLTTWDLAQVNASEARIYFQACVAR